MKLQISFDTTNLERAVQIAEQVADQCDSFAISTALLYIHGIKAIETFSKKFPKKTILVDTQLIDHSESIISLIAQAGAHWITVLAGAPTEEIRNLCKDAHKYGIKVMLDLYDSAYKAQSAMEAKNLGADAILFHETYTADVSLNFQDTWDMVKSNSSLPIVISADINRDNFHNLIPLKPYGMVIGSSIINAEDPVLQATYFYNILSKD